MEELQKIFEKMIPGFQSIYGDKFDIRGSVVKGERHGEETGGVPEHCKEL